MSPTHKAVAEGDKLETRKRLGENISKLVFGGDMFDGDCIREDVRAKMMEADREMLGARTVAMICSNFDATLVVFEDSTVNAGGGDVEVKTARLQFVDEVHKSNDFAEGGGEGDILGLGCGQGDDGLHFGGPNNGATGVRDEVAGTGVSRKGVGRGAVLPGAGPVCINEAFKATGEVGFECEALVLGG